MSTTFDVFPKTDFIPSFDELFETSSLNFQKYLIALGIHKKFKIKYHKFNGDEQMDSFDPELPYITNQKYSIWIYIDGIEGGIDGYYDAVDKDILDEIVEGSHLNEGKVQSIKGSLKQDYYWSFRRSVGQPAIINILYGIIAGTLADMTEGIVFSGDCAWEYRLLPAEGEEFLGFYMNPKLVLQDVDFKSWARDCIADVKSMEPP